MLLKIAREKISNVIVWSWDMGSSQPEIVPYALHPNRSSKKIKFTRVGTPMWLIYATAQELSLQIWICNPCSVLKNDFRA